jgi:DNA-binding CsgD family transcriptional regulator
VAGTGVAGLVGRDGELSAIAGMLRGAGGRGLLLVGEPGAGKSALLHAAADLAARDGRTVLRAAGVPAEAGVPYAGLHQLLYPLAAALELLAPRPREVLRAAFGHADGPAPDMFPAAVATLELLAGAAAGGGLLVVADDLHWMDDATLGVLRFVARRIASVPVALLATIRHGFEDVLVEADMPIVMLRPLRPAEAERMVLIRHPDLDAGRRAWVLEHAAGNPLALAELPLTAGPGAPAGGAGPGAVPAACGPGGPGGPGRAVRVPLTARLEHSFAARLRGLSAPARMAAVVAAAADGDDFAEIAAAITLAVPGPGGARSLHPVMDAGILTVSQAKVTFEHPLMRSAIYSSAGPELRRQAHAALAEVLDMEPQRQAWHLAAAAVTPDQAGLTALPRLLAQQARNAIALSGEPLDQAAALIGQALTAGLRGDGLLAGKLARQAEAMVLPARVGAALCGIQFVRGVTAIGAGRYDEAFGQLGRMFDRADPAYQDVQSTWALGDLAEAAVRTGRGNEARELLAAFRPARGDSVTPWTRVALLYAAPLLAGADAGEEAGAEAVEQEFRRSLEANLVRWPFYRARLLLEYGSWLRRRRRIAEARAPLRHAHQVCEAHGLIPWAERARQELRATGEGRETLRAGAGVPLSPQELQIARLAAEGLSNREIGQRLYLSHRTIGSHLYRIFPKLSISSRAQLGSALAAGDAGLMPGLRRCGSATITGMDTAGRIAASAPKLAARMASFVARERLPGAASCLAVTSWLQQCLPWDAPVNNLLVRSRPACPASNNMPVPSPLEYPFPPGADQLAHVSRSVSMIAKEFVSEKGARSSVIMKSLVRCHVRTSHSPPQPHPPRIPSAFVAGHVIVCIYPPHFGG